MGATDMTAPSHVTSDLIYDYDVFNTPALFESPHWEVTKKLRAEAPPIFYTPRNGGHWVISRAADLIEVFRSPELFSSDPAYNRHKAGNPTRNLPLFYDPPEHGDARLIVTPLFVPNAVKRAEGMIRELCADLIDDVLPGGGCELVSQVAQPFPAGIFLHMANAPLAQGRPMIEMVGRYLRSIDPIDSKRAMGELGAVLQGFLDERRADPGDDILSLILRGKLMGRPLRPEEILGAAVQMYVAGLDTTASMISFALQFLARNPGHCQRLVDDPAIIPAAVEELMRVSGVASPERGSKVDHEFRGVNFRKGDRIVCLAQIAGMDEDEVEDPFTVNFDRDVSRHIVFGSGPHRCLGSHLARLEARIFLEEWTRRIPTFRIEGDEPIKINGGQVWQAEKLPLVWN